MELLLLDGHNVLLNLAAACSVAAVMAMLALWGFVWSSARRHRTGTVPGGLAVVAFAIGFLDVLANQGMDGSFEDARFVWFLLGMVGAAARLAQVTQHNMAANAL